MRRRGVRQAGTEKTAVCDMSITMRASALPPSSSIPTPTRTTPLPHPQPGPSRLLPLQLYLANPTLGPQGSLLSSRDLLGFCRLSVVPRDVTTCQRTCCRRSSAGQGVADDDEAAPATASDTFRAVLSPLTTGGVLTLHPSSSSGFFVFPPGPKRGCLGGDKRTKMTRNFSRWSINDLFDVLRVLKTSYSSAR